MILSKENKFQNREGLASYLGVGVRTLYNWTQTYKLSGLDEMLKISNGGKRREIITAEHRKILESRLNDRSNPFKGYKDAQLWFIREHGLEFKYQTLRVKTIA